MSKCEQCIVRQFSSIKAMTKDELLRISECKSSQIIRKGEVIFEEGEYLNGVFCVKDGVCKLTKLSSNGKSQIVRFIKKGDILGQRSVISEEAVNLSAVAVEDMMVCFIPKDEILTAFRSNPNFSVEVVRDVCHDLKEANNTIVDMAQKTVKQRLADALLYLDDNFGTDSEGFLKVHLSREELGNMVGTATESLIRMLSDFGKQGLINMDGKRIKLSNVPKLKRLSEGV
ncbi:Crp/Fnr family transcriptional regulator [Imtechella halotolerans]|uniref:Crp/Fnr family transcriptional regulator n=1 Tax=Imtechella halotolerans K1 TaxID=946077 RepID=I0WDQ9_9FLAO|nr:Crp/Fnr family transcriptional regulator [Imtechella halotolerans K1]